MQENLASGCWSLVVGVAAEFVGSPLPGRTWGVFARPVVEWTLFGRLLGLVGIGAIFGSILLSPLPSLVLIACTVVLLLTVCGTDGP